MNAQPDVIDSIDSIDRLDSADDAALAQMSDDQIERYARHLVLRQVGPVGQQRLARAHVAIIGMGGIGCPVAQYLAASGVGTLTLVDDDQVSTSNLSRQILFGDADVGTPKVQAAARRLAMSAPACRLHMRNQRLDTDNAAKILSGVDLVIDGTDTHPSRLLVSSAAHDQKIALVSASVLGVEGQLALFSAMPKRRYADLFPRVTDRQATCADVGVLSPATGMVGSMAASMAIQGLVAGSFDAWDGKCGLISAWPPSLYWIS